MSEDAVKSEKRGAVLEVVINRPEKRNAVNAEVLEGLGRCAQAAALDNEVRAVLVRGEGKAFSAGLDLPAFMAGGGIQIDPGMAAFRFQLTELIQRQLTMFESMDKPVVCAIQGACFGFGLEIALAADLRVAHPEARIALQETRLGLIPDVGGTTRLVRTVGRSRAKDIIFTAREVPVEEALRIGLVDRVAEDYLGCARDLCDQIAANAPMAVGLAKRVVERSMDVDKHTSLDLEGLAQSMCLRSEDLMEGMSAALEKRKPAFKNQ